MGEEIRLNLGAGACPLPGYVNVDIQYSASGPGNLSLDWSPSIALKGGAVYPLADYADGSASECRASHVLEHFGHREVPAVLQEWVRVLRPGGVLKIAVPDLEWIATNYIAGLDAPYQGYLMGGQVDENDFHRSVWDAEMLREALEHYGLVDIREWKSEAQDCAALPCSCNLQGTKPGGKPKKEAQCSICQQWWPETEEQTSYCETCRRHLTGSPYVRYVEPEVASAPPPVTASQPPRLPTKALRLLLSAPRLGFTDNMFCAYEAAVALGCPLTRNCGVYWHQATENLLEEAERDGFRYAVVFDYDSVFTAADVYELYRLAEAHPEADAIMGLQMRREKDAPLLSVVDEDGTPRNRLLVSELQGDLLRAASGHLGLTLFRLASLARVPHPWFQAVPDAEGRWGEGRVDADVALWTAMREAGLSLYLAPRIVVGHLQMLVTWPSREFKPLFQYPSDWVSGGRPQDAWR